MGKHTTDKNPKEKKESGNYVLQNNEQNRIKGIPTVQQTRLFNLRLAKCSTTSGESNR
jgi:hypothetical protein